MFRKTVIVSSILNALSSARAEVEEDLERTGRFEEDRVPFHAVSLWLGRNGRVFAAAVFLVSVPVLFQAPLVRSFPWLSLGLTLVWMGASGYLAANRDDLPAGKSRSLWGDLLFGFSWSWLAGSLYWGWWRWEPLLHLPIEAIALPFAIWCLWRGRWQVGSWFYIGSLFGTALTDAYFYANDLIPYWRDLMRAEPDLVLPVFQQALARVQTPLGIGSAAAIASVLLFAGLTALRSERAAHWAFGGAVLGTIPIDLLFFLVAHIA